jgi:hypothetical protein
MWHIWGDNGIMDAYVVLLGKLREKDNFEDTAFKRMIILKFILMKYNERAWAGCICVGTGTSSGSSDHCNEPLDAIQCRKFL